MIIDGHAHACGDFLTAELIIEKLKHSNADMVVLAPGQLNSKKIYKMKNYTAKKPYDDVVQKINKKIHFFIPLTGDLKKIPQGNEYIYNLKMQLPDKICQFYWVTKANYNNLEKDYERMHFSGIKFHQCWEIFDINSDWFAQIAEFAASKDLPIFIHMFKHQDAAKLIEFIKKHPQNKIIVAHLFGVELFIKEDIKYFNNVYFDISNCNFVSRERIILAYNKFGSKKLTLGSDTPFGIDCLEKTIELVNNLDITDDEKADILGNNMMKLLKI